MGSSQGSCLCGKVTFVFRGFLNEITHCHCRMCRKFHGAAFATLAEVSSLIWLSGEDLLKEFTAPNGAVRTFCQVCGSSLSFRERQTAPPQIALATLDETLDIHIDAHVFTDYKANWYPIQDNLPTFAEDITD